VSKTIRNILLRWQNCRQSLLRADFNQADEELARAIYIAKNTEAIKQIIEDLQSIEIYQEFDAEGWLNRRGRAGTFGCGQTNLGFSYNEEEYAAQCLKVLELSINHSTGDKSGLIEIGSTVNCRSAKYIEMIRTVIDYIFDPFYRYVDTELRSLEKDDSENLQKGNAKMNKIKILFLSANPADTNKLALDEEIREITAKIRAADRRDSIDLLSAWAVRPDDLLQLLNQHKPQIVHFSGHGSNSGEIILTDNNGVSKPVSSRAIMALFTTLKDNVRAVVLNACYSKEQAETITQVIDCVVGMSDSIGDKAAITFAASFYRAIGFGRSIQEAFDQGIAALLLEGIPEEYTPELLVSTGIDPSQVILVS
jgi:hypothetical protein